VWDTSITTDNNYGVGSCGEGTNANDRPGLAKRVVFSVASGRSLNH
jgi:hypothetical protein